MNTFITWERIAIGMMTLLGFIMITVGTYIREELASFRGSIDNLNQTLVGLQIQTARGEASMISIEQRVHKLEGKH